MPKWPSGHLFGVKSSFFFNPLSQKNDLNLSIQYQRGQEASKGTTNFYMPRWVGSL